MFDPDILIGFLANRRSVILAGAGCSTGSGIPDYGGLASRNRKTRIRYSEFANNPLARKRYWARATVGWGRIALARPNDAHFAMAQLESSSAVTGVITQNVDGLHQRAGTRHVVELHGNLERVVCMHCGGISQRDRMQSRLLEQNPWLSDLSAAPAPDGDSEIDDEMFEKVMVPDCRLCGGQLKPDVVFFGESVPADRVEEAWRLYSQSDVLIVAGSSLAVFSGYRFALRAHKEGKPIVIVNRGPTRADSMAAHRIDADVEEVLPAIAAGLSRAA